jgi:hypothetical protein
MKVQKARIPGDSAPIRLVLAKSGLTDFQQYVGCIFEGQIPMLTGNILNNSAPRGLEVFNLLEPGPSPILMKPPSYKEQS